MKKKLVLIGAVIALGIVGGVAASSSPSSTGATESPIVTEVSNHDAELKNHEARISNTESNVKGLQDKTSTPPSTNTVEVPVYTPAPVPASEPAPTPPAPITVTAYREIVVDSDTSDCEYTYSDGSVYRFQWKTTNPQGAWVTDGGGQNGHWVSTTHYSSICGQEAVGQIKIN